MINVLMSSTTPVIKDGITNVMLNLYSEINHEKFHVDFITINEPDIDIKAQIERFGGKYRVIERSYKHPFRFVREYSKACKGYDIVHVNGNSSTIFLELFAAKIAGIKVRIAHSHNTYCKYKIVDKVLRLPFYLLANVRLACGDLAGKWLFGKKSFSVVNNGIDCEKFSFSESSRIFIRNKLGMENKKIIGHVGNFLLAKNHDFIIKVFLDLLEEDKDYRLVFLGNGERMDEIKELVLKENISEYIYFAGSVHNVQDYLSAMDMILMPSINEGFPLTLVEEQANGLSCLVSNNITEQVNLTENVYFLSLSEDDKNWALKIDEIFRINSSKRRTDCSKEAIIAIKNKHYDINKSVRLLEKIYINEMERK